MAGWKPEYAVCWHEGMFLLPAHFQLADRRNDFLLAKRFSAASPLAWGVIRSALDVSQLGVGLFRVLEIEAVLPDGLYVHCDSPLEISLAELAESPNTEKTIWLTVPIASPNPVGDSENKRFLETEFPLQDPSTEEAQSIPLLAPNVMLFLGDPPSRFSALPLAKVSFQAEGFTLHEYVPPQMLIRRENPIFTLLLDLVTTIRNRATALIRQNEEMSEEERTLRFEPRLLLPGLLGHLPMLETLLFSESVHPLFLFGSLSNLAGSLCGVGHLTIPRRIEYDHLDPLRCFTEQIDEILREMEKSIPTQFHEIPFSQTGERFSLAANRLPADETLLLGVAMKHGTDESKLVRWFEHAVIGFQSEIESLIHRRSVGAERKQTRSQGLFALSKRLLFWEVKRTELLQADDPFCVIGANETDQMSRPAGIYLMVSQHKESEKGETV